jgi:hypothetical protein
MVTAARANEIPAIGFEEPDHVAHFHSSTMRVPRQRVNTASG